MAVLTRVLQVYECKKMSPEEIEDGLHFSIYVFNVPTGDPQMASLFTAAAQVALLLLFLKRRKKA